MSRSAEDWDYDMPDHTEVVPLLVTEKAAARLIGISNATLIAGRFRKQPILPFVRVGKRAIRYRLTDIYDFIDRNVVRTAA
jgi:hypothetical protein